MIWKKVKGLTFVDQSGAMIEVARKTWNMLHPEYRNGLFYTQSTTDPLPATTVPKAGSTTVLQTMGILVHTQPSSNIFTSRHTGRSGGRKDSVARARTKRL